MMSLISKLSETSKNAKNFEGQNPDRLIESAKEVSSNELTARGLGLLDQLEMIKSQTIESISENNLIKLETKNSKLEGDKHPETGVPFERQIIQLNKYLKLEGVFAIFEHKFETYLPKEFYNSDDKTQEKFLNEKLKYEVENNKELRNQFTEEQLNQIRAGYRPEGFTWHHHQEPGKMQLVDSLTHLKTGHTGGRSIWCNSALV